MPDLFTCRAIFLAIAIGITLLKFHGSYIAIVAYIVHVIFHRDERRYFSSVDVAVCQPMLTGPMSPICPRQNESVTITCKIELVASLIWRLPENQRISFTANEKEGRHKVGGSIFTAVLVNKSTNSSNEGVADLTSILTASTMAITNGTIIACEAWERAAARSTSSSVTLILAGAVCYSCMNCH